MEGSKKLMDEFIDQVMLKIFTWGKSKTKNKLIIKQN